MLVKVLQYCRIRDEYESFIYSDLKGKDFLVLGFFFFMHCLSLLSDEIHLHSCFSSWPLERRGLVSFRKSQKMSGLGMRETLTMLVPTFIERFPIIRLEILYRMERQISGIVHVQMYI